MVYILENLFLAIIFYVLFIRIGIAISKSKEVSGNYIWISVVLMVSIGISFVQYIYNTPSQWYLPIIIILIGILSLRFKPLFITQKNVLIFIVIRIMALILCVHFLYNL